MNATIVAQPTVTVNTAEESQVEISPKGIKFLDVRAYSPKLVAAMTLEDAVAVAKAILMFVETEDEAIERQAAMREDWFAVVDSALENW